MDGSSVFTRIDPANTLYPPFFAKLLALVVNCGKRGMVYVPTCGLRTYAEQDLLYVKGRTTGEPGHIVTKARGGQSPHNFKIAVDFCKDADSDASGLQPDYHDAQYLVLAEEAVKLGLEAGYYWKPFTDTPHVQLPVKAHGLSWAMLDNAYRAGGYPAVEKLLDAHGPW